MTVETGRSYAETISGVEEGFSLLRSRGIKVSRKVEGIRRIRKYSFRVAQLAGNDQEAVEYRQLLDRNADVLASILLDGNVVLKTETAELISELALRSRWGNGVLLPGLRNLVRSNNPNLRAEVLIALFSLSSLGIGEWPLSPKDCAQVQK